MNSSFLIIVPVFNGARYLDRFIAACPAEYRSNLLFIDDGSQDELAELLRKQNCRFIRHESNRGKGAAIKTGIAQARQEGRDFIVTMDIDLQHPPGQCAQFIPQDSGQIKLGYRRIRKGMPWQRKLSNFLTSLLLMVRTNTIIKDSQCGYRGIPVRLLEEIELQENGFQMESELLLKAALSGYRIEHIQIPTVYQNEPTAMRPVKDTLKFIRLWFRSYLW